ncbi:hypothetical protein [Kocuria sp. CH-021]|uniref:hypothetical protein n=1 Tax=Kocuria sp. CH-021 TaxID=3406735 RepID=UPI003C7139C3
MAESPKSGTGALPRGDGWSDGWTTDQLETLRRYRPSGTARWRRHDWNPVLLGLALLVAALAVMNVAMRFQITAGVTTGYALAIVTMPLWLATAARYRYYPTVLVLAVVSVATGLFLTLASSVTHEVLWSRAVANSALLGGSVLAAGVILWTRPVLAEWQIGMLLGAGLLLRAAAAPAASNPWKSEWAVPVIVLVLAVTQAARSRVLGILALVTLSAISAVNDSRSLAGMLLMTAVILSIQLLPLPDRFMRIGTGRALLFASALGYVIYWIFTRLALNGAFGAHTQLRSEEQVLRAGSLILGARPEIAATAGLFRHEPAGFGSGTVLNPSGIAVAQEAMGQINYDADNGYVYNYMFGRSIELHSGIGDLWALFGLPGLVLVVVVVWALLNSLAHAFSTRSVTPLQIIVSLLALWNVFFGPLYSLGPFLVFSLGLILIPHGKPSFLGIRGPLSGDTPPVRGARA